MGILRAVAGVPWRNQVAAAEALGFGAVLLPVEPGFGAGEGWAEAAGAAKAAGVLLMADVAVHEAAAGLVEGSAPFTRLTAPLLDPRGTPEVAEVAPAAVATAEDAEALARWWGGRIGALQAEGVAGVRLLGLGALPGWSIPAVLAGMRAASPGMVLFGWTPGVAWEVLEGLAPGALDLVASSLPWWDGHSDWMWRELELLRRIAPVVAEAGDDPARHALAAVLAEGWMATADAPDAAGLNRARAGLAGLPFSRLASPAGSAVVAVLRTDRADPRAAGRAVLAVTAVSAGAGLGAAAVLPGVAMAAGVWTLMHGMAAETLAPGVELLPRPGSLALYVAEAAKASAGAGLSVKAGLSPEAAARAAGVARVAIEAPSPCVEGGRFPARRVVGSEVVVEADIITDGHDQSAAMLCWQAPGETAWHEVPMVAMGNDRWRGRFPVMALGVHRYSIEAWRDAYATFVDEVEKKHRAGVPIGLELQEGAALVAAAAGRSSGAVRDALQAVLKVLGGAELDARRTLLVSAETRAAMARADDRPLRARVGPFPVQGERPGAGFASWYEVFPRSMSDDEGRHGTFRDVERHLPRIQRMGFDVLYFPPIHPIGRKNRKGRNNTLTPGRGRSGSPYAIGSAEGGHDALHPELGTVEDFQRLRAAAAEHGIELAIDFAIQCSPDHPWLEAHKGWFNWRPDGTIRYAENPPKRYEDIVNVDFYGPDAVPGLWVALAEAVLYWAGQGVRLFRVDNPHTKPLPFWEWMIGEVQARYPDAVFLAEAFTRPKVMYRLAKAGFSQSYTYFTWRNTKQEFTEYLTELSEGPAREFFRPHFFVNTPDINPVPLQTAPRSGFLTRAALAATLSGLWGVYNGFELCDATPIPGREEYLDSEKYQLRKWDWERPGNITREIGQLNAIRRGNPALQTHLGVTFLRADADDVLWFEKATEDRSNVVLVAVAMDLQSPRGSMVEVPFWRWAVRAGGEEPGALDVDDLIAGRRERWTERRRHVALTPEQPYGIWRVAPASGT